MGSKPKIPIWLDCDPGHDDAFAILLAAHHPNIHLLGISTVHGNSSLAHTTHNALSLLTAMGATKIPVYPGAAASLTRPAVHAPAIHGESGLDGTDLLPEPSMKHMDEPAIDAIAKALSSTPNDKAWLIATGALTNIAMLFNTYPNLASHIKGLSIMGGAIGNNFTQAQLGRVDDKERIGNWSAWAEFNILVDPEAASQILSDPILSKKTTLIPLDVTHLVLATPEVQTLLLYGKDGKKETVLRKMLVELLDFFAKTYADVFGIEAGPPLHDPLAVATIFDGIPGLEVPFYDFEGEAKKRERFEVKVVTEGNHSDAQKGAETGRTIVKLLSHGVEGVKIPRGLDVDRFWEILGDCLKRADTANGANSTA